MMGNFSFGDYFKEGAVELAWELSLGAWGLDRDRIWATVYRGSDDIPPDDEAREIWLARRRAGRAHRRARRRQLLGGRADRPLRPVLRAVLRPRRRARLRPARLRARAATCDRFLEYWNLVFMQYDRGADGLLTPLPKQNIDTGAGLERVAALLQGVHSVYEADVFRDIISAVEGWTGARYTNEGAEQKALRVLADHGRSMTMLAADGVIPSNESRGYILRRIIRRAVQHGSRIGLESPFLAACRTSSSSSSGDALSRRSSSTATMCGGCSRPRRSASRARSQTGSALLDDVIERTRGEGRADDRGRRRVPAARHLRLPDRAHRRDRRRGRASASTRRASRR